MPLHDMTSAIHKKGAKLSLEFSETVCLGVKERAQHAGLLQHEVSSKVSASLYRMHDIIWLLTLSILISSFLWFLGLVTVPYCWLHNLHLSWHLAWSWGSERNHAHALHTGILHAPACIFSNSKELMSLDPWFHTQPLALRCIMMCYLEKCIFVHSVPLFNFLCLSCGTTKNEFLQIPK